MTTDGRSLSDSILTQEAMGKLSHFIEKLNGLDERIRIELKENCNHVVESISRNEYMHSVDRIIHAGINAGTVKGIAEAKQIKETMGCESFALSTRPEDMMSRPLSGSLSHSSISRDKPASTLSLLEKEKALEPTI